MYNAKELTVKEICQQLTISRPTLYRYLKEI
jgi:excisionase family DNA binding protein